MAVIEEVCLKHPQIAGEPGTEGVLKHVSPKPNITKEEAGTLKELKQDRVRLTADKWVALVVLDIQEYIRKAMDLWWVGTPTEFTCDPSK